MCVRMDYFNYRGAEKLCAFYRKVLNEKEYSSLTILKNVTVPIFTLNHHSYKDEVLDVFTPDKYNNVVHVHKMGPYLHNRYGPAIVETLTFHTNYSNILRYYFIEGLQMQEEEWEEVRFYR